MTTNYRTNNKSINRRIDKYVRVTLTNAQLLAMYTTGVTLVPAITGFTHIPEDFYITVPAQTTGATIGSATYMVIKYTNVSGTTLTGNLSVTGLLDQTTLVSGYSTQLTSFQPTASAALVVAILGANVTAMTGGATCRLYYKTLPNQLGLTSTQG